MRRATVIFAILGAFAPAPAIALSFAAPDPFDHTCRNYPASATVEGLTGMTLLSVSVTSDGRVLSSAVTQSSGHNELDAASRACVQGWRYPRAAKAVDHPVRIIWARIFRWHDAVTYPGMDACLDLFRKAALPRSTGPTVLDFRITPDRRLVRPVVAKSSGSRALDRIALRCTTGWRPLRPPSAKGDVPWKITLTWPSPLRPTVR